MYINYYSLFTVIKDYIIITKMLPSIFYIWKDISLKLIFWPKEVCEKMFSAFKAFSSYITCIYWLQCYNFMVHLHVLIKIPDPISVTQQHTKYSVFSIMYYHK